MDLMLDNLLELLEAQTGLYRQLLRAIETETDAAVASDLESLSEASKIKENLLLKIRILEEQRIRVTGDIAAALACPLQGLTLTRIARMIPDPLSGRLSDCRRTLSEVIGCIQTANRHNKALMLHSLEFVRGTLHLLGDLMTPSPVYYSSGRIENSESTGRLISGAV